MLPAEKKPRMIQNPQKLPQDILSLRPKAVEMPPSSMLKSSENHRKSLVSSTKLCLYDKTWPRGNPNKRKRKRNSTDDPEVSCRPSDNKLTEAERNIARMRFLSYEERPEEERYEVSTELTLFADPWTIKKVLTTSDLGQLSRLLLQTNPIQDHILKYLTKDDQNSLQEGPGIMVNVYDHDTDSTHELLLKRWTTLRSYVLNGGWRMYFVRRRGLRKGDEVGLFWDRSASRLHFRVLSRAALEVSVDQKNPN